MTFLSSQTRNHTISEAQPDLREQPFLDWVESLPPQVRGRSIALSLISGGGWNFDDAFMHVESVLADVPPPVSYRMLLKDVPESWDIPEVISAQPTAGPSDSHTAAMQLIFEHYECFPLSPQSGMSHADVKAFFAQRKEQRQQLIESLLPQANGLLISVGGGMSYGVSQEARPDGDSWRITRFDADMSPMGHECFTGAKDALSVAIAGAWMAFRESKASCPKPTSSDFDR